ncbi:hypothetical protein [Brucella haematophila]|uniref:hypothetical protein n=1 Tax=Brucella haematophila TaxID=419474 RepID=UPI00110F67C9|nr:hypothetical protein [Brucella haematophila]TMV05225.1 hypothetical protein FGI60_04080 [Brucella haematophila]
MTSTGLAAVQVKAGEDQKSNNLPSLVFFKVLEFLGQKKAMGQIPKLPKPSKRLQMKPESRA